MQPNRAIRLRFGINLNTTASTTIVRQKQVHMGVVSELENGEVDLVIGCFGELPGGVRRATLY
jgi:hypothetical protein